MRTAIVITVNGKEVLVPKDALIGYDELCRLANVDPAVKPVIVYSAGPLRAGKLDVGEMAPLKKYAQYNVSVGDV
jgi:hypothetical protein